MEIEALKFVGAGLAAMGMIGPGIGLGILFGNYYQAVSRNPGAAPQFNTWMIIGFALTEALGIFAFLVALLLLFAV